MPTRVILIPDFESLQQRLIPNLKALLDAAKLGFDAINRGESLALHTRQDMVDFVNQAGLQAINKLEGNP